MEKQVKPLLEDHGESQLLGILAAVFAIIVTLVLFAIWKRRRSVGQSILVTGLSEAGKTLLYAQLLHRKFVKTHTSIKDNIGDIIIKSNTLRIVDIPGDDRLRYKYFDKHKTNMRALIYVIDSVTIQKNIFDVAEFLYTLLSDSMLQRNIPCLILCNKQDQTFAKSSKVIKEVLEKEMQLLRVLKNNQLEPTDASSKNSFLGKEGKDFKFSDLSNKIDFAECYVFNKDPKTPIDIQQVENWFEKHI